MRGRAVGYGSEARNGPCCGGLGTSFSSSVGAIPKPRRVRWYSDIHSPWTIMRSGASGKALCALCSSSGYSRSTSKMKPSGSSAG